MCDEKAPGRPGPPVIGGACGNVKSNRVRSNLVFVSAENAVSGRIVVYVFVVVAEPFFTFDPVIVPVIAKSAKSAGTSSLYTR
jgi:hypothetical protein